MIFNDSVFYKSLVLAIVIHRLICCRFTYMHVHVVNSLITNWMNVNTPTQLGQDDKS